MITKKFIRNSIIYTAAGALPMASAIILLPFYLKYLTPDVFGTMAIYTGFSLLVQVFVTYSFDTSVYNYFHEFKNDNAKLRSFISSVFIFILLTSLLLGSLLAISGGWIFEIVFKHAFAGIEILFYPYGMMAVATGIFQAVFKVNSSLLQTQEKASSFLWYNILSFSLISAFTIGGLIIFPDNLIGPIGGRFAASAISGVWVLGVNYRQYGFTFNWPLIKSILGYNQTVLIYQLIQWVNNYYDRVLMTSYLPMAQVGIYDFAAKCLSVIELVITGFNSSFYPKVLGAIALQPEKKTTQEINRYYHGLTAVAILLVTLSIFFFPIVIEAFVTKPGYRAAIPWIPMLAVTYLLRSMRFYVAMPYSALKYAKPLPYFYFIMVAIKILTMIVLLPKYGIMGVIIAIWVGYIIEIVFLFFGIKKKFTVAFNVFKLIAAPIAMAVLIVVSEPLLGVAHPLLTHALYILIGILVLVWVYRNELKTIDLSKILR